MIDTILTKIFETILTGGPGAVIAILIAVILALGWWINRQSKEIEKKDTKIEKIVDDYYKGNITSTEALNGLRIVLVEIKAALK